MNNQSKSQVRKLSYTRVIYQISHTNLEGTPAWWPEIDENI